MERVYEWTRLEWISEGLKRRDRRLRADSGYGGRGVDSNGL